MKTKAFCLLIRGRKIVAKLVDGDVVLPGGDVDKDKAQEQLSALITQQCGVISTKPVLIADVQSMNSQLFVAYVNSKKQSEVKSSGSWDDNSLQGHYTDDVYSAIEKISKQTVMHQLLMLAMKLVKMIMDKSKKQPSKAQISNQLITTFSVHMF